MPKAKRTYKSDRQIQRRVIILDSARKLVSEVGYDGLTMRGLADIAQVSPKTLYNLFNSKDELLLAAVNELLNGLVATVRQHPEARGFSYLLLRQKVFGEEICRNPDYAAAMARALFQAKPEDALVKWLLVAPTREILVQLKYEQRQNHLQDGLDLEEIARHLALEGWGILLLWNKGIISLDEIGVETRRSQLMIFSGISCGETRLEFQRELTELSS